MKFSLVLLATAASLLAGCARHYPDSPLDADTNLARQCAAIRGNVPWRDRGTRADPTVRADSLCVQSPGPVYGAAGPGADGRSYPGRAVVDSAFDY